MLYSKWLDEKQDIDIVLFEFSKAFAAVSHTPLLINSRAYGFNVR